MTSERVDKGWTKQGLGKYSTEAIFGSLSHYGARSGNPIVSFAWI